MAAGFVNINMLDAAGTSRAIQLWSSDGTAGGTLSPAPPKGVDVPTLAGQVTAQTALDALVAAAQSATPSPVTSPAPTALATVTIANGAHLSGAIQIDGKLAGLLMSAAWTAAPISAQVSMDNVAFADLWNADGTEWTIAAAATAGLGAVKIPLGDFLGFKYVKFRSGTSGTTVDQGAARVLTPLQAG